MYLYNITPLDDWSSNSTPANMLYRYSVRVKDEDMSRRNKAGGANNPYQTGEEVWVKQPGTRCDQRYKQGIVTGVVSDQVTEIDDVPRHIRDIRHRIPPQRTQDIRSNSSDASDEEILMTFSAQDSPGLDQAIDGSDEDANDGASAAIGGEKEAERGDEWQATDWKDRKPPTSNHDTTIR
ncbi:hypothetical protein Pmani_010323 [Petrolisthes manimaculis]|uniref:Uncharacterized protein n=1 Tax=Petrolisthes manimaculis TaxID=1843537 RepID=A0AAE1U5L8_9EUCA|nr:hypothetical protein Pmani_021273 [Petrolisthes manimaculis]KAK4318695.1 hypothetical protein Pmani_010323 [Petrolisthes manimaculis]